MQQGQGTGKPGGLNFGGLGVGLGTSTSSTGGLTLGGGGGGLNLGGGQTSTPSGGGLAGGLNLGVTGGVGQTSSAGFQLTGFGAGGVKPQSTTPGGLQLGGLGTGGGLAKFTTQTASTGGLQLGQTPASGASGLQLGAPGGLKPSTQATAHSGLQLGQTSASGGLQLGQLGGSKLGAPPPAYSTTPPAYSGPPGLTSQIKATSGLQLGATQAPTFAKPGLQLGQTTATGGLQLGGLTTQATKTTPQIGLQQKTTAGGLQLGGQGHGLTAPTLGSVTTAQTKLGSLGTPSLGLKGGGLKTTVTSAGSMTTTAALSGPVKKYTYKQLEDLVNKWTLELQNQEKLFHQQAAQVNKWDRVLAENGDKIVELHDQVDRVKADQKRVTSELDMIQEQQSELEEMLTQLEGRVPPTPIHSGQHADMQRTKTFTMAENIDSQLKQMSKDLKMIIEQMNESNTSTTDEDNPFTQIVRILNAHTDSLGWIDHEAALLRKKVDDVTKVTDYHRQEQELSFRKLAFNH